MQKKWTHTAAFAHFGTKPRNVQWSWSARNEATKTVVVTLWQDEFVKKDGRLTYSRPGFDQSTRLRSGRARHPPRSTRANGQLRLGTGALGRAVSCDHCPRKRN